MQSLIRPICLVGSRSIRPLGACCPTAMPDSVRTRNCSDSKTISVNQVKSRAQEAAKAHNTTFGFEKISAEQKKNLVKGVFDSVASKYDLMNDVTSFGVHHCWKDYLVERIRPIPGQQLLDVAGGTGDIALRFLKQAKINGLRLGIRSEQDTKATVCDISTEMLAVGKARPGVPPEPHLTWLEGDAENLPFESEKFDIVTIGFGMRNVTHMDRAMEEAHRVLKAGGRFFCLEFSHVDNPVLSRIYDLYSFQVIPVMGQLLAGDWKSYQYLVESIRKFPSQEVLADMIREAGFKCVSYENLFNGIAAIHVGFKL
ncbi:2-methoxy-6-polyprenyl-1,4-benzoquinol methylase, mitochondrial-like isoform X1 [Varroa destructor]|uniref:2-methoxy-6-polyprenyl-1,4-benzoquinol methylase, mitochondrial n=1 Tax=Varroa destructor TaxID=109461 RepID=A0A7M7K7X1_VARDE|nr:2-methoxy-6-polyprenyl-1,4-benzoquinol methylase, mitochondrial-like isoform X1 [Varroa destructor]